MKRLWVVMCLFRDGSWDICDFAERPYCSTDFYEVHRFKRAIQDYLYDKPHSPWKKKRFKIKEYFCKMAK